MKPNYEELGFSNCMGPLLRREVEIQLLNDLNYYIEDTSDLKFDWSESCVEGTRINYLDGDVEDFSGIKIFNMKDQLVAEGWMNFYFDEPQNLLLVYWDILELIDEFGHKVQKKNFGVPFHVNEKINKNQR